MNDKAFNIDFERIATRVNNELRYFKEYIDFNTEKLSERTINLQQLLQQDILENPENKEVIEQIYEEDNIRLPAYFYHSTIVSLYSLLENHLNELCELIIEETEFAFELEDFSDKNIIKKARNFLTKIGNVDFNPVDKIWMEIATIQKVRNLIIHNSSHLKSENVTEQVKKLISTNGSVDFDKANMPFYITNRNLLTRFVDLIQDLLKNILKQLSETKFVKFEKGIRDNRFSDELPF